MLCPRCSRGMQKFSESWYKCDVCSLAGCPECIEWLRRVLNKDGKEP